MNKTLYIKDKDEERGIWKQAEQIAPAGLSALVTSLLADYVSRNRPPDSAGFERIEVETQEAEDAPLIRKAFTGRTLVSHGEIRNRDLTYLVAQTQKGRLAVHVQNEHDGTSWLRVYDSFDDFRNARTEGGQQEYPAELLVEVATQLEQPYTVELDI